LVSVVYVAQFAQLRCSAAAAARIGRFHKVTKKYLHLYVAELQFRYNNRHNADIFGTAIEGR
jgi:hypothetical protein